MLCIVVWYSSLNKYRFQWEDILFSRFFFKVRKIFFDDILFGLWVVVWWYVHIPPPCWKGSCKSKYLYAFEHLRISPWSVSSSSEIWVLCSMKLSSWTSYNLAYYFLLPRLWQILKLFHSTYSSSIKLIFLKSVSYYLKGIMYVMQLHYWAKCVHCSHTAMLIFASFLMFV